MKRGTCFSFIQLTWALMYIHHWLNVCCNKCLYFNQRFFLPHLFKYSEGTPSQEILCKENTTAMLLEKNHLLRIVRLTYM